MGDIRLLVLAMAMLVIGIEAALVSVSDFGDNPTELQMSIYVPDKLATKPAVILAVWNIIQGTLFMHCIHTDLFRCMAAAEQVSSISRCLGIPSWQTTRGFLSSTRRRLTTIM